MSALVPVVNIYFDTTQYGNQQRILLTKLTSSSILDRVGLVAADQLIVNLWPRITQAQQGAVTLTQQLANPGGLMFTAKALENLSPGALLVSVSGFTEQVDTDGNYYYTAVGSLNFTQLLAALGEDPYLQCLGEIENVGGMTSWQRFQFPVTIYTPVYNGTESLPTSAQPFFWNAVQSDARYLRGDSGLVGKVAIVSGVSSVIVNGLTLPFTPETFLCFVSQVGGSPSVIHAECDDSTATAAGFTANLTGATEDTLHLLRWIALPPAASFDNGLPPVPAAAENIVVAGAAAAIDLSLPGLYAIDVTAATGAVALTLTNPITGAAYLFQVTQGAPPRAITFPAGTLQKGGGGRTYTPSGANAVDLIRAVFNGTHFLIEVEANYA